MIECGSCNGSGLCAECDGCESKEYSGNNIYICCGGTCECPDCCGIGETEEED